MKILGKSESGWIVEASGTELANIMGYYAQSTSGCPQIGVGNDIDVQRMYQRNQAAASLLGGLSSYIPKLREAADLVEEAVCFRNVPDKEGKKS